MTPGEVLRQAQDAGVQPDRALRQAQDAGVQPADRTRPQRPEPVEGPRRDLARLLADRCGGAVVGVAHGAGTEVSTWGERVPGEPIGPEAVFDLASVTKLLTTLAVGRAVAQGHLGLDSTVSDLWPGAAPAPLAGVDVEQLLRHRSGLAPWAPLYLLADDPTAALGWITRSPLVSVPGSTFAYSDLGMILLGALLERVSGSPLAGLLETTAAELAGGPVVRAGGADPGRAVASDHGDALERRMVHTGEPHPVPSGLDVDGFGWRDRLLVGETDDGNAFHVFGGVAGHAGAFASVPGMLRLGVGVLRALAGADPRPVARGVRLLLGAAPVDGQGLGFRVRDVPGRPGGPRYWHPGFTGTALVLQPGRDLVLAMGASRLLAARPEPTTALLDDVLAGVR